MPRGDAGEAEGAIARLRLMRSARIGPVTYRQLVARFGDATAALDALPDLARRGGGPPPAIAARGLAEKELAAVARLSARHIFLGDPDYPFVLAQIATAPPALIAKGEAALLDRPLVAMVGARNASAAACRFARQLAHDLGEAGIVVVSGLARGIDAASHQGALASGTIGVVAGGIDVYYPPENEPLQRRMETDGLVVAEQPPGTEPRARHFPYRNRIIAGLAQATVIVEAAPKSGSLITARQAAEFGREVMAVPGSPLDPRAQGCNLLIRDGATLIQSAADILESLAPIGGVAAPRERYEEPPALDAGDADRRAIAALLGPVPVAIDEIVRQSARSPAIVQTVLLELELAGRLDRHAGGRVALG